MKNQVLSIEQMKHMRELGVDTSKASMDWVKYHGELAAIKMPHEVRDGLYTLSMKSIMNHPFIEDVIPAFMLIDIIDILPRYFNYDDMTFELYISPAGECNSLWMFSYRACADIKFDTIHLTFSKNIIDAAYEMLCWAIENEYIKQQIKE